MAAQSHTESSNGVAERGMRSMSNLAQLNKGTHLHIRTRKETQQLAQLSIRTRKETQRIYIESDLLLRILLRRICQGY